MYPTKTLTTITQLNNQYAIQSLIKVTDKVHATSCCNTDRTDLVASTEEITELPATCKVTDQQTGGNVMAKLNTMSRERLLCYEDQMCLDNLSFSIMYKHLHQMVLKS